MRTLRISLAILVFALLAGLGSACKNVHEVGGEPSPSPAPALGEARKAAEPAQAEATGGPVDIQVSLVSPGEEPRAPLRYKLAVGTKDESTMRMATSLSMRLNGQDMPSTKIPVTRAKLTAEVKSVSPEGDARCDSAITSMVVEEAPGVEPMVLQTMKTMLEGFDKMDGYAIVDPRGFVKEADLRLPADLDPQMKQLMGNMEKTLEQLTSPFPEEAVGIGGRWETRMQIEQNGIQLDQVATYEVVERTDEHVKMKVSLVQTAPEGEMSLPGMPPGIKSELLSLRSTGSGTVTTGFAHAVPLASALDMTMKMSMKVSQGGDSQTMDMTMGMKVTFE